MKADGVLKIRGPGGRLAGGVPIAPGGGEMHAVGSGRWPYLPIAQWQDTRDTLQLFTQIVGKVSLAKGPLVNHWWNCALRVTARGLSTTLMPHPGGQRFQIGFDFQSHRLEIVSTSGAVRSFRLTSLSVADFYTTLLHCLDELGLATEIWPVLVEIAGAVPFTEDRTHASYDAGQLHRFCCPQSGCGRGRLTPRDTEGLQHEEQH